MKLLNTSSAVVEEITSSLKVINKILKLHCSEFIQLFITLTNKSKPCLLHQESAVNLVEVTYAPSFILHRIWNLAASPSVLKQNAFVPFDCTLLPDFHYFPRINTILENARIECVGTLHVDKICDIGESQKKMKRGKAFWLTFGIFSSSDLTYYGIFNSSSLTC